MKTTEPAIRVMMMPRDTNGQGTIFGGVLLSYIDQAGAIEAQKMTTHRVVTVAIKEVVFISPVFVGDVVSFYTEVVSTGRTSITTRVKVQSSRITQGKVNTVDVTEAVLVFVAVDRDGRPVEVKDAP